MSDFLIPLLAGAITGVLSGAGLGGGTLLMLYLTGFAHMPQRLAQSTNLLYALSVSPAALLQHLRAKRIPVHALWKPALLGILCALLGALLAGLLTGSLLRRIFGGFLCLVSLRELFFLEK